MTLQTITPVKLSDSTDSFYYVWEISMVLRQFDGYGEKTLIFHRVRQKKQQSDKKSTFFEPARGRKKSYFIPSSVKNKTGAPILERPRHYNLEIIIRIRIIYPAFVFFMPNSSC
jgi:hypothetical protein